MSKAFQVINNSQTDNLIYFPIGSSHNDNNDFKNIMYFINYRQSMQSLVLFIKLHSLTRGTNPIESTVIDHINFRLRFNLVYFIQSITTNVRYVLSTWSTEILPIMSLQNIYPAFNWSEREIWDMFGLFIIKHPDLRRILTDYGFIGHPLRKDFPLTGFKEIQFEDSIKHVEYANAELAQSFNLLRFSSAWSHE